MIIGLVPALLRVTNHAEAVIALNARHAALVDIEGALLAQACDALICASQADVSLAGKADLIATARKDVADATAARVEIEKIEACWRKS
jgi:hypothetical protein